MGSMYRQVSWLAALARPIRLPDVALAARCQWLWWGTLAAYSCGGSLGIGPNVILTVFPILPPSK